MALIQLGIKDGSTLGNPTAADYWFFNNSNNPDATGEAQFTRRDSNGIDIVYGSGGGTASNFNVNLNSSESSVTVAVVGGRTVWTVTHNLNTLDLSVEVFRISNGRTTNLRIDRLSVNTLEASRAGTIAEGTYRIIIK